MNQISEFASLVRERRTDLKMSVRALARAVGCSHVHLGELERGKRSTVGAKFWPALGVALGLAPDVLKKAADASE